MSKMTTKSIWSYFMSVERTWTSHCEGQSLAKLACFCANWLVTSFLAIVATTTYNIIVYMHPICTDAHFSEEASMPIYIIHFISNWNGKFSFNKQFFIAFCRLVWCTFFTRPWYFGICRQILRNEEKKWCSSDLKEWGRGMALFQLISWSIVPEATSQLPTYCPTAGVGCLITSK